MTATTAATRPSIRATRTGVRALLLLFKARAVVVLVALLIFFSSLAPLMAAAFLLGLGLGAAQPNVMSLLHSRSPEGRVGEALGLRTTIMNSSHVVLPVVFGAFGSVLGAGAMFWAMAALVGTGGGAALRWRKHRR